MIHIVGGTYREVCLEGNWDQLFGSGLRAAAAIRHFAKDIQLSTFLKKDDVRLAQTLATSFGFQIAISDSPQTVRFTYEHGLGVPHIAPPLHLMQSAKPLQVAGESALLFGMVDGEAIVTAERAVHDPQSTYSPRGFRATGSIAKHLAVVCNSREAWLLTGVVDPEAAARKMLSDGDADIAVVKCGSAGAILVTNAGTEHIPAFKTPRVWPIGSGDVFAAVFAAAWLEQRQSPLEAAKLASKATAYYCCTQSLPVPSAIELDEWAESNGVVPLPTSSAPKPITVYLAGPFFSMMERWLIEQSREALNQQGMKVFSPLHDVGIGGADDVVPKDLAAIESCDVLFALLDHLDSGTLFEVGYARSIGKPVVGFCQNETPESLKMLSGSGCVIFDDFVTAIYHTKWLSEDS